MRESLPAPAGEATTASGYDVELAGASAQAGQETELAFTVRRDGQAVNVQPYLGAGGHLVVLREGDMAFLHVHPVEQSETTGHAIRFETEFPSAGRYRLFLQFKQAGEVHTAEFTQEVTR